MTSYSPEDVFMLARSGDVDSLIIALKQGNNSREWYVHHTINNNDDDNTNLEGAVAIHAAAYYDHTACIDVLLDAGADIESKDDIGCTAIHGAAWRGHTACIGVLLDRGADIESKQNQGATALHLAACQGHTACIGVLLDRGADIESMDHEGSTALHKAAQQGHIHCIAVLLDRGADIESMDNDGDTALHRAACQGHIECTRLFLDRQAMIDEAEIDDIDDGDCKQMILDEIRHRLRRAAFDSFISHHIEYPPLIHNIYSTCYPSGDLRVAPAIGWDRAEAVRNKYYFDEVLFYVHVYVANELAKKAIPSQKRTRASSRRCSNIQAYLATNSDDTSTLMTVLSDRLKMYLKPV